MNKRKIIILAGLAILTLSALYAWKEYSRGHVATSAIQPAHHTTATELVAAFEADETSANAQYNDKVILVNGKVQKVSVDDKMVSIAIAGSSPMSGVICQFEKSEQKKLQGIKPGDMIAVKGVCTGYLMDVILVRCALNN